MAVNLTEGTSKTKGIGINLQAVRIRYSTQTCLKSTDVTPHSVVSHAPKYCATEPERSFIPAMKAVRLASTPIAQPWQPEITCSRNQRN